MPGCVALNLLTRATYVAWSPPVKPHQNVSLTSPAACFACPDAAPRTASATIARNPATTADRLLDTLLPTLPFVVLIALILPSSTRCACTWRKPVAPKSHEFDHNATERLYDSARKLSRRPEKTPN